MLKSTHEHQLDYISTVDEKKKLFKIKNILILILEKGLTEEADMLDQLGALETLLSLMKSKFCYQALTTTNAFKVMTKLLVSDSDSSKKHVYLLLISLI